MSDLIEQHHRASLAGQRFAHGRARHPGKILPRDWAIAALPGRIRRSIQIHRLPMSHKLVAALLFLFLSSLGGPSWSASTTGGSRAGDAYDIEMVIFERFNATNERWPADPGEPPLSKAVGSLSNPGFSGPDATVMSDGSKSFDAIAYTLKRKGFRIHAHIRWRQQVGGRSNPDWYRVGDSRLGGLIHIGRSRFLHFDTDLLLQRGQSPNVRIQLHSRMRSGELHYLDHPLMGILVQADRVEPEALPAEPVSEPTTVPTTPSVEPQPPEQPQPPSEPRGDMPRAMPDPT